MPEVSYNGRKVSYTEPLGIYLDGKITGSIHDSIIPKYHEIIPEILFRLNAEEIEDVKENATRQLNGIAQRDSEQVRRSLRNTIDITTKLLEKS